MSFFEAIQAHWGQFSAVAMFIFLMGLNVQQLWSLVRRFAAHRKLYFENREKDAKEQVKRDTEIKDLIEEVRRTGTEEHQELAKKVEVMDERQRHQGEDIKEIKEILKNGNSK